MITSAQIIVSPQLVGFKGLDVLLASQDEQSIYSQANYREKKESRLLHNKNFAVALINKHFLNSAQTASANPQCQAPEYTG